jgi:uncharacterized protein YxeA
MKKIISIIMAIVILATFSMTAFAANDLTNSVGSVATDSEAVQVIGNDATQGKVSEYEIAVDNSTATNETNTKSVDVYATQGSTYSVKIPKTIILDGSTGNGAYRVSVKGNISGNQTVKVIPDSTFVLSEVATVNAKSDITAVVTQAKTAWTTSELSDSTWATQNASISVSPMSAGSWHGTFGFTVSIENAA